MNRPLLHSLSALLVVCGSGLCSGGCDRSSVDSTPPHPTTPSSLEQTAPATLHVVPIRIIGHDYAWRIQYSGPDNQLDTADDQLGEQNLDLPAHRTIRLELGSEDYAYSLYLPALGIMEIAMPGDPYPIEFQTGGPHTSDLLGSQMCGYIHPRLLGKVVVGACK